MKIINEKGRLFGIINIVDLGVLIIALLIVFGAAIKFTGGDIKAPIANTRKIISVTLKAAEKKDFMFDAFKKGDQLMYGNLLIPDAYIQKVEITPTIVNVPLPSGKLATTEDPLEKDINITFTAPVDSSSNVIKLGNQEIRIGATYVIDTKNARSACYVTKMEYVD